MNPPSLPRTLEIPKPQRNANVKPYKPLNKPKTAY
jgi:hypothetical protein